MAGLYALVVVDEFVSQEIGYIPLVRLRRVRARDRVGWGVRRACRLVLLDETPDEFHVVVL